MQIFKNPTNRRHLRQNGDQTSDLQVEPTNSTVLLTRRNNKI